MQTNVIVKKLHLYVSIQLLRRGPFGREGDSGDYNSPVTRKSVKVHVKIW